MNSKEQQRKLNLQINQPNQAQPRKGILYRFRNHRLVSKEVYEVNPLEVKKNK